MGLGYEIMLAFVVLGMVLAVVWFAFKDRRTLKAGHYAKKAPLENRPFREGKEYWGTITAGPYQMAGGIVEFSVTVQNADTIFNPHHYGAIASEQFAREQGLAVGSRVLLGPWRTNGDKGFCDDIHIIECKSEFVQSERIHGGRR